MAALLKVDPPEWVEAVAAQDEFFTQFGARLPREIRRGAPEACPGARHPAITPPDVKQVPT